MITFKKRTSKKLVNHTELESYIAKKCKCGFPIPSPPRTMLEGWLGSKRIIQEHTIKCRKCGTGNKVTG